LFIAYLFAWFHFGAFYSGDGTYRTGVNGAAFQVEFAPVDLSRVGRYTFHFTRLAPPQGYVVGLRVYDETSAARARDDSASNLEPGVRPRALVAMSLQNERGQVVFRHQRRLDDWDWLRNIATISGKSVEVLIGGGSVRIENQNVEPDGGWGTHFTPRWSGRYRLTIEVLQPDPAASRLVVHPVIEGYTGSL
jgi:hypothetical protein